MGFNHVSGLARYTLDTSKRLCVVSEVSRYGLTPEVFEQVFEAQKRLLERLVGDEDF